ncbi:MAG: flagellar FlbD family protein [Acidobacteriota bacterium]
MIKLTLLDETEILINSNQINAVESAEHATIELKGGDKIKVKESSLTILNLIRTLAYRDSIT